METTSQHCQPSLTGWRWCHTTHSLGAGENRPLLAAQLNCSWWTQLKHLLLGRLELHIDAHRACRPRYLISFRFLALKFFIFFPSINHRITSETGEPVSQVDVDIMALNSPFRISVARSNLHWHLTKLFNGPKLFNNGFQTFQLPQLWFN